MRPAAWPHLRASAAVSILFLAAVGAGLAASGQQQSLGVTPGLVAIPDAQSGQSYLRTVTLQNQMDTQSTMTVDRSGLAGQWVTTEPASGFLVAARSSKQITLTIQVPVAQGPGSNPAQVTFTTEPKGTVSGSGQQIRYSVGVLLNITVGGEAIRHITWGVARVSDVQEGEPVVAVVLATNAGNVADDAIVAGTVMPFAADAPSLAEATGRTTLRPGESRDVEVTFAAGLGVSQYRVRLRSTQIDPLDVTLPFKVFAAGTVAPSGTFRGINHEPFGFTGEPIRLDAWFHNDGSVRVAAAKFKAEVRQDGRLLAALESDALAVPAGSHANLTVYWTPPAAGTYLVNGTILYDGYLTLPGQSIVNVKDKATVGGGFPWIWLLLLLLLVIVAIVYLVWRRRRAEDEAKPPASRRT